VLSHTTVPESLFRSTDSQPTITGREVLQAESVGYNTDSTDTNPEIDGLPSGILMNAPDMSQQRLTLERLKDVNGLKDESMKEHLTNLQKRLNSREC